MTTTLEKLIYDTIKSGGPLRMDEFMALALGHPEYGYYMTRDPIGQKGDFITAPEISQLFGEMIAAWCMHCWSNMGKPSEFALVECGPGRGTLMADIIRTSKIMPDFQDSVSIHLIENSLKMIKAQRETLKDSEDVIHWHSKIEDVPDMPFILIANEFLDALPVRQLVRKDKVWYEQSVGLSEKSLTFFPEPLADEDLHLIPQEIHDRKEKTLVFEYSAAVESHIRTVAEKCTRDKGYALYIDYGYTSPPLQPTIQAVKNHRYASVLKKIGEQDITAHTDFSLVSETATKQGCLCTAVVTQGDFLTQLGIEIRADVLARQTHNDHERLKVRAGLGRLIAPKEMGNLFKAIALFSPTLSSPEGFFTNDNQ